MPSTALNSAPWDIDQSAAKVLARLRKFERLGRVADIYQGTGTRADRVFLVSLRHKAKNLSTVWSDELEQEVKLEPALLKRALRGRSIKRYALDEANDRLIVPYRIEDGEVSLIPERELASIAPLTLTYLRKCKSRLNERENGRFAEADWYCYGRPQNMTRFDVPEKVILPDVVRRGECCLDLSGIWLLDTAYAVALKPGSKIDLRLVLAVLNSPILTFFLRATGTPLRGGYFRMKTAYLEPLPVPQTPDKKRAARVGDLVDRMLSLHQQHQAAQHPQEKDRLRREIDATDRRIDQLVYQLYELTDQEIRIVEAATAAPGRDSEPAQPTPGSEL